jgi:hypothetical protein
MFKIVISLPIDILYRLISFQKLTDSSFPTINLVLFLKAYAQILDGFVVFIITSQIQYSLVEIMKTILETWEVLFAD